MATANLADQCHLSRIYRPDFAVRLREGDFADVQWQHSFSFADPSMLAESPWDSVAAGSTEWTGIFNGQMISVGWDFFVSSDGHVFPLQGVPPRSNIRLLDVKGYDQDDEATSVAIWTWLRDEFWHEAAKEADDLGRDGWLL